MPKLKSVVFDIGGTGGGWTVRRWTVRRWEIRAGKRYEQVATFGLFASKDEAQAAARKAERDYKAQLPQKPLAPFRLVVSYKERGNYGETDLHLECGHTVTRKGGWYITEAAHKKAMARGEFFDPTKPRPVEEGQHRARCERCLEQGIVE
jgi:hypothetical protein